MKTMICGDVHACWGNLNAMINREQDDLGLILQCGDFGWFPQEYDQKAYIHERKQLMPAFRPGFKYDPRGRLKNTRRDGSVIPLHFCRGNHEDHADLARLAGDSRGAVEVAPGLFFQPDGSTLTLPDGRVVLFAGGAKSADWKQRNDWQPEEVLTTEAVQAWPDMAVDIVVSHTVPARLGRIDKPHLQGGKDLDLGPDPSRDALDLVLARYRPRLWFAGHFHRRISRVLDGTRFEILIPVHDGGRGKGWVWLDQVGKSTGQGERTILDHKAF